MPLPPHVPENASALARITAGLFALLGLTHSTSPQRIAREIHRKILRILRPAESAVRRLIVVVAQGVRVKASPPRPMPRGLARTVLRQPRVSFQLFDPRQRYLQPSYQRRDTPRPRPRLTIFGDGEVRTIYWGKPPRPAQEDDGLRNAASLVRRLQALKSALDDLPAQARRLARALARRRRSKRPMPRQVMRPGRAPGLVKKPVEEIHRILDNCDWLARDALAHDTS